MMESIPLSHRIRSADETALREVLREAELHLSSQLAAAIAADSRSYTFAGAVSAAAIILVGAAYTTAVGQPPDPHLSVTALAVATALFVCAWMSVIAARSVKFEFTGNQPCKWASDIEDGREFLHSLAEQCEHYDAMIEANSQVMDANGEMFNWAVNLALAAIGFGGISFIWWIAERMSL